MDWTGKGRWNLSETPKGAHIVSLGDMKKHSAGGSHVTSGSEAEKDADRTVQRHFAHAGTRASRGHHVLSLSLV